jgi:hypothetical protein
MEKATWRQMKGGGHGLATAPYLDSTVCCRPEKLPSEFSLKGNFRLGPAGCHSFYVVISRKIISARESVTDRNISNSLVNLKVF